jgi:thioredoxin 1
MPCRAIERPLAALEADYAGRVEVVRVNADGQTETARVLGVTGIPTLVTFREGREVARHTGSAPKAVLRELFEAGLTGHASPRHGPAPAARALRVLAAAALFLLGWVSGPSILLVLLAGGVFFSAVYDRCPLWRAVAPRLASLLRSKRPDRSSPRAGRSC